MKLYLLRHAEASYDANCDEDRELTRKGEKSIMALAALLKAKEFSGLKDIWHSSLVRARQTAELFNEDMQLDLPLKESDSLKPSDPPLLLLDEYLEASHDLMLVGHNPHLTLLASALLTGDASSICVEFKKSGLLCLERAAPATLERPTGQWVLRWYVVPKIVP